MCSPGKRQESTVTTAARIPSCRSSSGRRPAYVDRCGSAEPSFIASLVTCESCEVVCPFVRTMGPKGTQRLWALGACEQAGNLLTRRCVSSNDAAPSCQAARLTWRQKAARQIYAHFSITLLSHEIGNASVFNLVGWLRSMRGDCSQRSGSMTFCLDSVRILWILGTPVLSLHMIA